MNKLVLLFKVLIYPIIFFIGQFLIMLLFSLIFLLMNPNLDLSTTNLFNNFINDNTIFILILECLIFFPLFYFKYSKYDVVKEKYNIYNILLIFLISSLLSLILNFIILFLKKSIGIDLISSDVNFILILSTGFLGPILEEFLFRGIVYNELLKTFNIKKSLLLSSIIFAIFHTGGIFQIVFAFIIGLYLAFIYRKYGDLKFSMFAHIIVNMTSILGVPLLLNLL